MNRWYATDTTTAMPRSLFGLCVAVESIFGGLQAKQERNPGRWDW